MMLSAIAGSMTLAGGLTTFERRQRQRDAVRHRESRHDEQQPPERAAEQEQADQEQQMIRADEDVMDPRRQELPDDRERALPCSREVLERGLRAVENRLGEGVAFVHVDERLVVGVVRKERAGDLHRCRRAR